MNASHRADLINKIQKVVKKHYKPVAPPQDRTLFEHLLYACCLENASFEAADESFAKLQQLYFDWNEVRVTTIAELAETMSSIPDAEAAANRLKRSLQYVFETHYSYDLEFMKKQNIGKTQQDLAKFPGLTPFVVEYLTQHALGGHSIPLNHGILDAFFVLELITESEAEERHVPGLERAVPKNKGVEISSLLHQLGVEFGTNPNSTKVRSILTEIDPKAKDRIQKKQLKKPVPVEPPKSKIAMPTEPPRPMGSKAPSTPSTRDKESKEKEHKEKEHKDKDRKEREFKDKEFNVKESKDKESKEKESREKEARQLTETHSEKETRGKSGRPPSKLKAQDHPAEDQKEKPKPNSGGTRKPESPKRDANKAGSDRSEDELREIGKGGSSTKRLSKKKPR